MACDRHKRWLLETPVVIRSSRDVSRTNFRRQSSTEHVRRSNVVWYNED